MLSSVKTVDLAKVAQIDKSDMFASFWKSLNLSQEKEMILTFLHFPQTADDIRCQKKTEIIISDSVSDVRQTILISIKL